jgi:outer membrane biosynthesis protein TonB
MRKLALGFSAAALVLSLAACGETDQPENNIAADDLNAMTNLEELSPVAPAANVAVEETVTEARQSEPEATKSAPAKPAPATPKPTPAKPKPEPAAEPKATDPACAPEHRAAGHC